MDIEECKAVPLISGGLFLKIAKMVINVKKERIKLQMQDEVVVMDLWKNLKQPKPQWTLFWNKNKEKVRQHMFSKKILLSTIKKS